MAGRAGGSLGRLRQLRQHHCHESAVAGGVRLGPGQQQLPVPVGHQVPTGGAAPPSVGAFLSHSGWNSTTESICGGVSMLCWPLCAEQTTNCRYTCTEWERGMEIDGDVRREQVEGQVREMMKGGKGKEKRRMAMKWKEKAEKAALPGGPSYLNLERLINDVLLQKGQH
ncbi:hypothetical protein EJ110_NYTH12570 [Nymphaea thermarum]|nr:hypothetical protein EJ110_NYTH12570 [Nymphaea thermarum]